MSGDDRHLEYVDLDKIEFNPDNAKHHSREGVAASLDRFGTIDVPVVDERTGMLVGGHGRVETLRDLHATGRAAPEGIRVEKGRWLVPVVRGWASRDDTEATAAGIALNAYVARGGWNMELLTDLLAGLDAADSLDGVGYDHDDLAGFLKAMAAPAPARNAATEDSIEESAAGYRNKQVRTIVLDYPLDDYERVVDLAGKARARRGIGGNAELFHAIMAEWAAKNPT